MSLAPNPRLPAERPLPRSTKCVCGKSFRPKPEQETYCSKECAQEEALRALSGQSTLRGLLAMVLMEGMLWSIPRKPTYPILALSLLLPNTLSYLSGLRRRGHFCPLPWDDYRTFDLLCLRPRNGTFRVNPVTNRSTSHERTMATWSVLPV
ncbi:hypothetical protein K474DRAFT_1665786 [Panus rudis PR-1116 ss-1]|nr:hypothetical protein K474DRAFT_1665786 [Panus rudis PR-1116 ss-1]